MKKIHDNDFDNSKDTFLQFCSVLHVYSTYMNINLIYDEYYSILRVFTRLLMNEHQYVFTYKGNVLDNYIRTINVVYYNIATI